MDATTFWTAFTADASSTAARLMLDMLPVLGLLLGVVFAGSIISLVISRLGGE